ncbi:MAG: M48 family metallopeptidase [Planctomycetes bacterium]|nr:M48 family metallopeptidase [Planctomycetota bacterium]
MRRPSLFLAASAVLGALAACSIVGETGRSRVAWFPEDYMNELGAQAYAQETGTFPEIKSGPQYEMVQRLGRRIAAASGQQYEWEFKLLDAPNVLNAFALPGGKVAIYSGILGVTQNEAGLAAVVGHEVAHATAEHGNERMTLQLIQQGLTSIADIALESLFEMPQTERENVLGALGVGAEYGVQLPFSREHESEADLIGLRYLVRAGYDPEEAPRLWERMAALNPDRPPQFMSTHPDPLARAQTLRDAIPRIVAEERGNTATGN